MGRAVRELQDWDQIKAALRAEFVRSDEGRFIAAYRYLSVAQA